MAEFITATFYIDVVALVMLLGFVCLSRFVYLQSNTDRFFMLMSAVVSIVIISDLVISAMYNRDFAAAGGILMAARILQLYAVLFLVSIWLLFVDYNLNGSIDHLYRTYKKVFIPLYVITALILTNPFLGLMFSVNPDGTLTNYPLVAVVQLAEISYFLAPFYLIFKKIRSGENMQFIHINAMLLPVIVGEVANALLPIHITPLELTLALIFLYCSMAEEWRFEDDRSGFFNRQYLDHLITGMQNGEKDYGGVLLFSAGANAAELSGILEEEIPEEGRMLRLDDHRFLLCLELMDGRAIALFKKMLQDAVDDHNHRHPESIIEYDINTLCRQRQEDTDTWIERIKTFAKV